MDMEASLQVALFVAASVVLFFVPMLGGYDLLMSATLPLSQLSIIYGLTHCDGRSATHRFLCRCVWTLTHAPRLVLSFLTHTRSLSMFSLSAGCLRDLYGGNDSNRRSDTEDSSGTLTLTLSHWGGSWQCAMHVAGQAVVRNVFGARARRHVRQRRARRPEPLQPLPLHPRPVPRVPGNAPSAKYNRATCLYVCPICSSVRFALHRAHRAHGLSLGGPTGTAAGQVRVVFEAPRAGGLERARVCGGVRGGGGAHPPRRRGASAGNTVLPHR